MHGSITQNECIIHVRHTLPLPHPLAWARKITRAYLPLAGGASDRKQEHKQRIKMVTLIILFKPSIDDGRISIVLTIRAFFLSAICNSCRKSHSQKMKNECNWLEQKDIDKVTAELQRYAPVI